MSIKNVPTEYISTLGEFVAIKAIRNSMRKCNELQKLYTSIYFLHWSLARWRLKCNLLANNTDFSQIAPPNYPSSTFFKSLEWSTSNSFSRHLLLHGPRPRSVFCLLALGGLIHILTPETFALSNQDYCATWEKVCEVRKYLKLGIILKRV